MKREKIIALILFAFFVAVIVVTYNSIESQRHQIRKSVKRKIKAGLSDEQTIKLSFEKSEISKKLIWKHSKEFKFNGEMYDVIRKEVSQDSITFWCWWDNDETALNRKLDRLFLIALGQDPGQKQQDQQVDFYKQSLFFSNKSNFHGPLVQEPKVHDNYSLVFEFGYYKRLEKPPII